jgi:hypothetical protein
MKYLLLILLLFGCTPSVPSITEVIIQTTLPEKLKDCKRFEIVPTTYSSTLYPEIVYRCPNSITSTTVTVPQNKTTIKKTTIVIDGVTYIKNLKAFYVVV